ncbi:MOSC domain-containing protein [Candidatus Fermentibacteria bacterium]|nr:MAG: MOSC domain-containing protein [Candidatus Fermentibacteria bacterium]
MKLTVLPINESSSKGTENTPVDSAEVSIRGIENDAHAGNLHRQISILDWESITEFMERTGLEISPGAFGEIITASGGDNFLLKPGEFLEGPGSLVLEVTQVCRECRGDDCSIFRQAGKCVMPASGYFLQSDETRALA